MYHSSSCFQAEQTIMSSSEKIMSFDKNTSSSEQQLIEAEYVGVVRHPLSTYYIHKDIKYAKL